MHLPTPAPIVIVALFVALFGSPRPWQSSSSSSSPPPVAEALPRQIKIGALLHERQYEQELLFQWAIEQANKRGTLNGTKLVALVKRVRARDSWDAERKACQLLEEGAVALIGPSHPQTSNHVSSICDALDIPHVNIVTKNVAFSGQPPIGGTNIIVGSAYPRVSPIVFQSSISVDLSVSRTIILQAYLDVLRALNWRDFIYLYERDDSLFHLQEHFNDGKSLKSSEMNIRILRFDSRKPYREMFWSIRTKHPQKNRHIVLDVACSNLRTVLKHAQQVSMMSEMHSYLIVCLDTQTLDLEDFRHSRSRIVWLTAYNGQSQAAEALAAEAGQQPSQLFDQSPGFRLTPERVRMESALMNDAVESLAQALQGVDYGQDIVASHLSQGGPVSCKTSQPWPYGSTMVNYLRTSVGLEGMTGPIRFNMLGQRSDYSLSVMRLTEEGPTIIGNWSTANGAAGHVVAKNRHDTEPNTDDKSSPDTTDNRHNSNNNDDDDGLPHSLSIERHELLYLQRGDPMLLANEERDLLVVTSRRTDPYFMNRQTSKIETGNSRYEGYALDLVEELSRIVGFDYVFKEVDDGKYGQYEPDKGEWNGLIGEVMSGKADFAIADLSITSAREDAVDFTLPFMSTGISILFKKPNTKELELFSFLSPFETHVWVYVCGAYIGVSSILFLVSRISPYEWCDPHPCRQEDKIMRNQFSAANSFWFTMAAVMQQGSDLAPRSLSTRLISAIWYFFTMIVISSYTANLAAFLTVEKVVYPIERAEDLYKHPLNINYGCVESGSTRIFFQNSRNGSTFEKMSREMVFVASNALGIAEVERGNYAFFMESTSIEYTIERNCNLTQIGGLLDTKGYGIALAKNATKRKRDYRTKLSEAILSLQESGTLEVLKNRWWREKRGGGACDIDQGGEGVKELTLANVGGVFVVLAMGITVALILCVIELYAKSYYLATVHRTSVWQQVKRRICFAASLSENY